MNSFLIEEMLNETTDEWIRRVVREVAYSADHIAEETVLSSFRRLGHGEIAGLDGMRVFIKRAVEPVLSEANRFINSGQPKKASRLIEKALEPALRHSIFEGKEPGTLFLIDRVLRASTRGQARLLPESVEEVFSLFAASTPNVKSFSLHSRSA